LLYLDGLSGVFPQERVIANPVKLKEFRVQQEEGNPQLLLI
jgi:hypothetical protein